MKKLILGILLIFALILSGCGDANKVTGHISSDLKLNTIKNGQTTQITINGENTGKVAGEFIVKIIPEDANKLKVTYPGKLEFALQPQEEIGNKIINIQGFTDHSLTKYWIKVQLVNKADDSLLSEEVQWIIVEN